MAIYYLPQETATPPSDNITKEERLVLRSLKENNDIIILPADKINATVVMDRDDYSGKLSTMLGDSRVYTKLRKDLARTIEGKTTELLKKASLSPDLTNCKFLIPKESPPPDSMDSQKFIESVPLRPIVSNIEGPTHQIAKFLTKPLQKLIGRYGSYIENSLDFVTKLRTLRTASENSEIIQKSRDILSKLLPMIEHCLTSTYFQFGGDFYEQKLHAAMGSPTSSIVANIFMEYFENEVSKSASQTLSVWFRYVDDTFVTWSHERAEIAHFLEYLNTQHTNINFTMEVEQNGCLPFLDVLVQRNPDGTLGQQKNSVISFLMYKPLSISQPSNIDSEVEHLEPAFSNNGYKMQQIRRIKNRLQNNLSAPQEESRPEENQERSKVAILPYLRGTRDRMGKILGKHNIRTIFQPPKKIGQLLRSAKDPRPPLSAPGVYEIPCSYGKVYIGEIGRKISVDQYTDQEKPTVLQIWSLGTVCPG
ncbi:uncharacterized protein LOC107047936 [Diachasma alloeum]|uniref:uncharacterized protein LOC107047936 n=1 Tax=Diachasma alloeum TaxID=454923 RepID=UPI0007382733|nr:uncharacterized protein LOC107047936 [Diachasma alloeum]